MLVLALAVMTAVPHADFDMARGDRQASLAASPTRGSTTTTLLDWARRTSALPEGGAGETAIAPAPSSFDAPPAPSAPPPAALRTGFEGVVPEGGVWAVVIGINDYPGRRSDLRSATTDARDVDEALARYGVPPSRRLLLLDRQASSATIRRSLDWLVAHAGHDATAVVFYAGHVRKENGGEVVVAADGGVISDSEMGERLRPLRAGRTWIGMAACYGGGFTELLAPGRILTAAAGANSLAYETSAYGRSYLAEFMIRRAMIQGAAPDSIEASFAWAADALRREHPRRVPVQFDHAAGQLRLGVTITVAPPPPPPPSEQPPPEQQPPAPAGGGSSGTGGAPPGGGSDGGTREESCAGVQIGGLLDCG